MNDNHGNPPRLKDRHDQPDLVKRLAGQAARDMPEPPPLSAGALARIAMRIEERTRKPQALRLGRVLVAAAVLLGIVTVASAARMDLMPRWIAKMVGVESKTEGKPPVRPGKPRKAVKKTEGPEAKPVGEAAPSQPESTTAPGKALEASAPEVVPAIPVQAAGAERLVARQGKMAVAREEKHRLVEGGRTVVGHGHVYGHDHDHGHGHGHDRVYGQDQGRGQDRGERFGGAEKEARLAMNSQVKSGTRATPTIALPAPPAAPVVVGSQVPAAPLSPTPPPSERPAPAAPSAPAQLLPAPRPAPAPAPLRAAQNPAAQHLKEVVRALRIARAPRIALDLLDRHAHELAGNAFSEEALLLRVEALLALKQQPEALRLLDGTALANAAASSVLLVTRGQLRASANRCAEAITDFDLALARTLRPSKQALLGRAQCKQSLGDPRGAQADLDRLHREFPEEKAP